MLPAATIALGSGLADPAPWPHLRGPEYDGRFETSELALPWPEAGPPIVWRTTLGDGYSGFAIVDGLAYTQHQTPAGQFVAAIDVRTGERAWETRYAPPHDLESAWPGPYATPTHDRGRVFFAGTRGVVGSVDAETGELLWRVDTQERYDGRGTEFGFAGTPLVVDDTVFFAVGGESGSVVALDAATGDQVWTAGTEPASYVPCLAIEVEGRRQIVSVLKRVVVAHDPDDGVELWRHALGDAYNPHAAWPVWTEPHLFLSLAFRRGSIVLRPEYVDGAPRVVEVRRGDPPSNDVASSVVVDGHVYGFDIHDAQSDDRGATKGEFKCVELATGRERWSTVLPGHATVVANETHLVLFNETGTLILARADPARYEEFARRDVFEGHVSWTPPAVYGELVVLRSGTRVAGVWVGDPARLDPEDVADGTSRVTPVDAWITRHHDREFWAPNRSDLVLWFVVSGAFGLALPFALATPITRSRRLRGALFLGLAFSIGAAGVPIATEALGRLVFTWPASLFALFVAVYAAGLRAARARTRRHALSARAGLVLFGATCVVYFLACDRLYLPSGQGFLVGFVPAWPLVHRLARGAVDGESTLRTCAIGTMAYAVYYWSSVLFFAWKSGIL